MEVTKSLSNLYKQRYVVTDEKNARIINSNALIEEKLEELAKQQEFQPLPENDGFVAGLNMEAVEVVPKEEVPSTEETTEQKTVQAEEILKQANEQAEEILNTAKSQAEEICNQAQKEGHQQGLSEGRQQAQEELNELRCQIENEKKEMQADYQRQLEELEPKLVDVIADVFEQVFHVQFDDKKDILIYLIQKTILGIEDAKEFRVKVGEEDAGFLEKHMDEIREKVGSAVSVELMTDANMKDRQCIIETDAGIFDCGIDVQLENLVKALRSLSLRG